MWERKEKKERVRDSYILFWFRYATSLPRHKETNYSRSITSTVTATKFILQGKTKF